MKCGLGTVRMKELKADLMEATIVGGEVNVYYYSTFPHYKNSDFLIG